MSGAPSADPLGVFGAAEVVAVCGFGEPTALAPGLARPTAIGLRAEALMASVTRIGPEQDSTMQALTTTFLAHHPPFQGDDAHRYSMEQRRGKKTPEENKAKGKKTL